MKHLDDMEELFQQRFESFESEPADGAWQKIEERITPNTPANRWTSTVFRGTLLAILLILMMTWIFVEKQSADQNRHVVNDKEIIQNNLKNTNNQAVTKENSFDSNKEKISKEANTNEVLAKTTVQSVTEAKSNPTNAQIAENAEKIVVEKESKKIAFKKDEGQVLLRSTNPQQSPFGLQIRKSQNAKANVTQNQEPEKLTNQLADNISLSQINASQSSQNSVKKPTADGSLFEGNNTQNIESQIVAEKNNSQFNIHNSPLASLTSKPWQYNPKSLTRTIPIYRSGMAQAVHKPKITREVYVSVMPIYNFYKIQTNDNDRFQVEDIRVGNSDTRIGYRAEMGTFFDLSERFRLRTGISFAQTNQQIFYRLKTDSIQIKQIDNQSIEVKRTILDKSITEQHQYAGLRVDTQYLLFEGGIDHFVSFGLDGQLGLTRQTPHNLSLTLGYQLAKPIGKSFTLWVEPTLSQSLIGQKFDNSLLNINATRIGFHFGVAWQVSY